MNLTARIAFAALMAAAACAQAQTLAGAQRVEFDSGSSQKVFAHAFTPPPAPAGTRVPALVILHGSEGLSDAREGAWGRELAALGMVVFVVDSFTPRNVKTTVDDQTRVTTGQMLADAFGAQEFLAQQSFVDPLRIAVMGMSKGGGAALLSSDRRAQAGGRAFAAHLTLYPLCLSQYRAPQSAAPILMLLAENDDYTGVKPCVDYAERIRKTGGRVDLKTYKGAPHGFDGDARNVGGHRLANAQNFLDCVMMIEDDGRTVLTKTGAVLDTPQRALEALKRECMRTGATVASNPEARQRALADVTTFLKTTILKP